MITDKWILIVDDEDGILSILKNSLVKLGREYRVVTASDGYTALNHLKRFRFDLVVTDYKMAGMSGLELLERIHHVQPDMRVILMTGYGNNSVQAEATRLKAYQYLAKPLEIETFRQVIQEAIGNSAALSRGGSIMTEVEYREVNQILSTLQAAVGARCVFLTDCEGRFIARSGNFDNLPLTSIAALLGGNIATLIEAGRAIDHDENSTYLAYREGQHENLYVVNIGLLFLLILVIEHGKFSARLGSVWYSAQKAATALKQKFDRPGDSQAEDLPGVNLEQAILGELQKLLEHDDIPSPSNVPFPESGTQDRLPAQTAGVENPQPTIEAYQPDLSGAHGIASPLRSSRPES